MNHEEYQAAAEYWESKDAAAVKMPQDELLQVMKEYISANNTCALATGSGSFIRCTPIEYTYRDDAFWMFSEGGRKFTGLEYNRNVCLAIYDSYQGFGRLNGMQVTGVASIIDPFSKEYEEAAKAKKIPLEALKKLEHPMNLICVKPVRIDFLSSRLKEQGYSSRQYIEFK